MIALLVHWVGVRGVLALATGVGMILQVNRRGLWNTDRLPKWYVRVAFTLLGTYWIVDGFYRLGWTGAH
jgi:hypothetical protein